MTVENALDDIGHERGLWGIEFAHDRVVGPLGECAVDTRIDQPDRPALLVDKVASGGAADRVGFLPDAIEVRIVARLRAVQGIAGRELRNVGGEAGRRNLGGRNVDGGILIEQQQDRSKRDGRSQRADQDRHLHGPRRAAEQEPSLQVLRGCAAVRGGDADDRAHGEGGHVVGAAGPAHGEEYEAGQQQRCHRHAGDRMLVWILAVAEHHFAGHVDRDAAGERPCGALPGDWDDARPTPLRPAVLHIARRHDEFYPAERTEQYDRRLRLRCERGRRRATPCAGRARLSAARGTG